MEYTMIVPVGNDLIPINGLKAYLDEILNNEKLSLDEKKKKFISIKKDVDDKKRMINEEQIEPLNLIKKGADEYRKMIIEAQEAERRTQARFSKRLDELEEYGLVPETDGLAEQIANDLSYWTKGDRLAKDMDKKVIKLRDEDNEPVVETPKEDDDHTGYLLSDVKWAAAKYGAKVSIDPTERKITVEY